MLDPTVIDISLKILIESVISESIKTGIKEIRLYLKDNKKK